MNSESRHNRVGDMNFMYWLALVFITLKILGFIEWSWLWVLAPLWLGLASVGLLFAVVFITTIVKAKFDDRKKK